MRDLPPLLVFQENSAQKVMDALGFRTGLDGSLNTENGQPVYCSECQTQLTAKTFGAALPVPDAPRIYNYYCKQTKCYVSYVLDYLL